MNEILSSILGALIGAFVTHILERSKLKAARSDQFEEKKAREKAEAKLADIMRRANAPFFMDYADGFNGLYVRIKEGVAFLSPSNGNVICWLRDRVNEAMPEGETVYHVLSHSGQGCRWITANLDDEPVKLAQEAKINGAEGLTYLAYPLKWENFGKVQKLKIEFESDTGFLGSHTYLLKHGQNRIVRIDPPCEAP